MTFNILEQFELERAAQTTSPSPQASPATSRAPSFLLQQFPLFTLPNSIIYLQGVTLLDTTAPLEDAFVVAKARMKGSRDTTAPAIQLQERILENKHLLYMDKEWHKAQLLEAMNLGLSFSTYTTANRAFPTKALEEYCLALKAFLEEKGMTASEYIEATSANIKGKPLTPEELAAAFDLL